MSADSNIRSDYDELLQTLADYMMKDLKASDVAWQTAYYCLLDSIGCALSALTYPECRKLLGPVVPQTIVPNGSRVPGTSYVLDPIRAAFNIGATIRWLDYNDTWLAAEFAHPSDNLGAILALADYLSQQHTRNNQTPLTMRTVLEMMIRAYEIQGVLALENAFNRVGLDHVILVKLASAAVSAKMLGANREQMLSTLSLVFVDGQSLRTYRHAPNTGSRKSWAAGDASSRGLQLAWMVIQGEMGYPSAISAAKWGFSEVSFKGQPIRLPQPLGCYVMENILFKISFPAEFHAQTAVECAFKLYPTLLGRFDQIQKIQIDTQQSAVRIISKTGPLHNPADRDHCMQYMVAIGLLFGQLTAEHYEDYIAEDPRIDALRELMVVAEDPQMSIDYLDPKKRSIANAIQIFFKDGTKTERIQIDYPVGHPRRRAEGIPLLQQKLHRHLSVGLPKMRLRQTIELTKNAETLLDMAVDNFINLWVI